MKTKQQYISSIWIRLLWMVANNSTQTTWLEFTSFDDFFFFHLPNIQIPQVTLIFRSSDTPPLKDPFWLLKKKKLIPTSFPKREEQDLLEILDLELFRVTNLDLDLDWTILAAKILIEYRLTIILFWNLAWFLLEN